MKILYLSTYDINGGAAKSCYRLYKEGLNQGLNIHLLVRTKIGDDQSVVTPQGKYKFYFEHILPLLDRVFLKLYKNKKIHFWNVGWLYNINLYNTIKNINPDIIQLHWISEGYVPIRLLKKINKPIIWRLSDSWPFTGGCHIPYNCKNYQFSCGNCPQLSSTKKNDLSNLIWKSKAKNWKGLNITIVAPSTWMEKSVQSSSLFKNSPIIKIFPGVDTNIFKKIR